MTDEQVAGIARALAHPARVRIVNLLAEQTECRGHDVFSELPLAQSTVSEHLRVLKDAGVVQSQPVGSAMVYCLVTEVLEDFRRAIESIVACAQSCSAGRKGC